MSAARSMSFLDERVPAKFWAKCAPCHADRLLAELETPTPSDVGGTTRG
jgi:hypothetical protein